MSRIYATVDYYRGEYLGNMLDENLSIYLREASHHVDTLTFNRINEIGFDNLTPFQQEIIREVCCRQAEFIAENQDILNMILSGYSINGVSMQFSSSWNVKTENGIAIKRDCYELLCQTGLCCRLAV